MFRKARALAPRLTSLARGVLAVRLADATPAVMSQSVSLYKHLNALPPRPCVHTAPAGRCTNVDGMRWYQTRSAFISTAASATKPSPIPLNGFPRALSSSAQTGSAEVENTEHAGNTETQQPSKPMTQWSSTADLKESNEDWELIYEGQFNNPHKYLKQFSLSGMTISLISSPVIATFETQAVSHTGKLLLALATAFTGISTTAIFSFACAGYVERVFLSKHDPAIFEVVRLDWRARSYSTRFDVNVDTFDDQVTRPLTNVHHRESGTCLLINEEIANHPLFSVMFPEQFEEAQEGEEGQQQQQQK